MKYILDMVHHNPGEPPFKTRFLDPAHLVDYGFNGQVFKHINCIATFAATGVDCFPAGSAERAWLDRFTPGIEQEIAAAKAQGLRVFYHVDLFVLPKRLVEHFKGEICDPQTGRILLDRPRTLELHRVLFAELSARFPQVDGYIIRVGETYLFDTPHHVGNSPIPRLASANGWSPNYLYAETLAGREPEPGWTGVQADAYVKLIRFLREELCVQHGKQVFFRTWDIFPDKLHARLDHYLEVTDQIVPHPKLAFSIKHTALDFWRRVKVNECLTRGKHPQVIEVQCQREYEGKGAYPNYVMDGVINGFEENRRKIGLKDLVNHPLIVGVYSWSRGGGWYGPYIPNELWPDLNAYVLARFCLNSERAEPDIFSDYATNKLRLNHADSRRFRELCLLSARAILKGRQCEAFDQILDESILPTACWMRDDRLGGLLQLAEVFEYLNEHDLVQNALAEKAEAVRLWEEIAALARKIHWPDGDTGAFAITSTEYGLRLFRVVESGWQMMAYAGRNRPDTKSLRKAIADYDRCWTEYQQTACLPHCSTLYENRYFNLPGTPPVAGLAEAVKQSQKTVLRHLNIPAITT